MIIFSCIPPCYPMLVCSHVFPMFPYIPWCFSLSMHSLFPAFPHICLIPLSFPYFTIFSSVILNFSAFIRFLHVPCLFLCCLQLICDYIPFISILLLQKYKKKLFLIKLKGHLYKRRSVLVKLRLLNQLGLWGTL